MFPAMQFRFLILWDGLLHGYHSLISSSEAEAELPL